ncbi:12316_t:CDS:2 [Gigaspora rosea]|nr:12316_t:CDS:2 [Gigaspora rosea]
MEPFIYEQSSPSPITLASPIQNSAQKKIITEEQHNTRSKRSSCPWFINALCSKTTNVISITTILLEHETILWILFTNKFGTIHRTLTEPMLADIEFWTTKGNLSMPGMHSTQRVEGQNGIIKSMVNSYTSVLELFKKLDEQFHRASTIIQYRNWTYSVTGSTLVHSSQDFLPIIDKWIIDYLMPAALSIQRQKIAKAI